MAVEIKLLSGADIDQYIKLLQLGFDEELGQRGTDITRMGRMTRVMLSCGGLPLRLIKAVTGRGLFVLAAKDGTRVVGILTVLEKKDPILIGAYVLEGYRRSGVALDLVQEALLRLERQGYSRVQGAVIDHTAQLLLERAGFILYDHIDLYQRSLPTGVSSPAGVLAQRARRVNLPRHPYDLGPLNLFTGVRVRNMVVISEGEKTIVATLIALPHQTMAEIQPKLLAREREDTFCALLNAADEWLSKLGRTIVTVSLHDETASLASILTREGFVKRHSWVEMSIDL
ncbi:MAG: GNAT family N-acetyltransferase [Candidatus Bipolaricaulota bacterium]|nr:GNAT family N-acetyltransferase [Candidatus Bipolaricaulota bacterium]